MQTKKLSTCAQSALQVASEYPVFPVRIKDGIKRPALSNEAAAKALGREVPKGKGGHLLATRDPGEVVALFEAAGEDAVTGVNMIEAGLIAVDLDLYKGGEAKAWIEAHSHLFEDDRLHATPSGGLHILIRAPEGVKFPGKVPGLTDAEIKHRGFIVWPDGVSDYRVLNDVEPREMTPEQQALLTGDREGLAASQYDDTSNATYEQRVADGSDFHDSLLVLTRRWAEHGWKTESIVERCRSLLKRAVDNLEGDRSERAQDMIDQLDDPSVTSEVERMIHGAKREPDYSDLAPMIVKGPPLMSLGGRARETAPATAASFDEDVMLLPGSEHEVPARQWIYGTHYVRGFVSVTAAPGGTGKSTLAMTEAISMAMGAELLGDRVSKPRKVLYWCGEDPMEEIRRRLIAICKHYGIEREEYNQWAAPNLRLISGRDKPMKLATVIGFNEFEINQAAIESLRSACERLDLDVIVLDPFSSSHFINENSNEQMAQLMEVLRNLAEEQGVAIDLVHHTTKAGREQTRQHGVNVTRGASALIDAARSVRVLAPMTKDQAKEYQIGEGARNQYIEVMNGKSNMVLGGRSRWVKLQSVHLDNGDEEYPEGDEVGVVEPWEAPETVTEEFLFTYEYKAVNWLLENEPAPEVMRQDSRSRQWAGHTIAEGIGVETGLGKARKSMSSEEVEGRSSMERLVDQLAQSGILEQVEVVDQSRRARTAYKLRRDAAQGYIRGLE